MRTLRNFKLKLTLPLLVTIMVLCMGCPYESKYPLDGTKIKYNSNLIGTWHEDKTDLKITRVDDYTFKFEYDDHDEEDGAGSQKGKGYAITNNGNTYLIGERETSSDDKYVIYKVLSIEKNSLNMIPLDEDDISASKKFNSSREFTTYVMNEANSAFAYSNRSEFERGASNYTANTPPRVDNNDRITRNDNSSDVLFSENFQTWDNSWYSNYDFKDSNYIYIATLDNPDNHYYMIRNRKYRSGYFVTIPYYSLPNAYYTIRIDAKHHDGVDDSGYGIKFAASDWDNCYNFDITNNGYYRVSKNERGNYKTLVDWTQHSALYQGSYTNTMEIKVYYTYVDIYINDKYITRVNDFSRFGNKAGLEVYNNQTVDFDNLLIKKF